MGTKKKLKNIVLFGISLAISLIAIEIFLRFCQISLPSIVINHDKLGRVFRRNAALMVLNEGLYLGKINKYGYTGHAYPPQRDNDALRIALVGDSYVQGHYMVDCYYFGRVMEEKLEGLLKREVEVLNFGIAGSDLPRMYIRYKVQASKYKPDITLFILGPNDLLKRDKNLGGKCVLENGELKMNFDFSKSRSYKFKTRYKVFRNFAFYPLMQKAYAMVRVGKAPDILLDKLNPFESKKKKRKHLHKVPFPKQEGDRYFEINRAILAAIQDTATIDNQSTRNILVIKKELPLHYYKAINELGMTIVELEAQLQELRKRGIEPHYWRGTNKMGHWNHEAQDLIGNYLATLLTTDPGAEKESKQPKRGERELN